MARVPNDADPGSANGRPAFASAGEVPDPGRARGSDPDAGDGELAILERRLAATQTRLRKARLRSLRSERAQLIAVHDANQAGRAVWIVTAVGTWLRRPWRIMSLSRGVWAALRRKPPRPPARLARLDARIEDLELIVHGAASEAAIAMRDAREALDGGDYERTLDVLAGGTVPDSWRRRDLAARAHLGLGDLTEALADHRAALRFSDLPVRRERANGLAARLVETNTRWLPNIGGVPDGGGPPRRGVVLHLLKESLPFLEHGYTIRSMTTLLAQRQAGLSPVVVTSLGFPRAQGRVEFPLVEEVAGIPHHRLDLGRYFASEEIAHDDLYSHQATMVDGIAAMVRPAVLQASSGYHGFELPLTALAVGRRRDIPVIYEIRSFLEQTWTAEIHRSETGERFRRRSDQETRCLLESDLVITIADTMAEDLEARGVPAERIRVVPNVVDRERFTPRPRPAALAQRLGLDGKAVLGYISNIGPREGIDTLVRAVAHLRGLGDDVAGLVVGAGPELGALKALAADLGIAAAMVFTGHVPNHQVEEHYALIDVFVVPRINDRAARLVMPLKPLEAMSMGIPIVAADLPALREMLGDGDRGLLFEPRDFEGLARQAAVLLGDDEKRELLARQARSWVGAERSVESNAARIRGIFGEFGWG